MENNRAADLLIKNGRVYTGSAGAPWADSIAVKDGMILAVGSADDIQSYADDKTELIDVEGKMVLPGFIDAHMHPAKSAVIYFTQINLFSTHTKESMLEEVKRFVKNHPDQKVLKGAGFQRSVFDELGPRKEWLDAIEKERPIGIYSSDGHSLWANSKAIETAGITGKTPQPAEGMFKIDPDTGEPSGLFQEFGAMRMIEPVFPEPTKEEYKEGLLKLQQFLNERGLTTVFDAMVPLDTSQYAEAYQELALEGKLTVRYRGGWLMKTEEDADEQILKGISLSQELTHPHFQVNTFKFFADHVIEEETGYLHEPYAHRDDDWRGIKVWDDDVMKRAFTAVDRAGYQIHVHQIGDAAATYTLDALKAARQANGERDARPVLAHIQLLKPEDIGRMQKLGVVGVIAPYWMVADDYFYSLYKPYLGEPRVSQMYPLRSLIDGDVPIAIHCDFSVNEPDLMWALYSGVTRRMPKRISELWYGNDSYTELLPPIEEAVSLEQIIKAATAGGAYSLFLENEIGTIEPGKKADFVVLEKNLFDLDVEQIPEVAVEMTFFEGKQVFTR